MPTLAIVKSDFRVKMSATFKLLTVVIAFLTVASIAFVDGFIFQDLPLPATEERFTRDGRAILDRHRYGLLNYWNAKVSAPN